MPCRAPCIRVRRGGAGRSSSGRRCGEVEKPEDSSIELLPHLLATTRDLFDSELFRREHAQADDGRTCAGPAGRASHPPEVVHTGCGQRLVVAQVVMDVHDLVVTEGEHDRSAATPRTVLLSGLTQPFCANAEHDAISGRYEFDRLDRGKLFGGAANVVQDLLAVATDQVWPNALMNHIRRKVLGDQPDVPSADRIEPVHEYPLDVRSRLSRHSHIPTLPSPLGRHPGRAELRLFSSRYCEMIGIARSVNDVSYSARRHEPRLVALAHLLEGEGFDDEKERF